MARKQGGLGRNFYEILDDNLLETKKDSVTKLRVADIEPRRDQPRKTFERESLEQLAINIKAMLARKLFGDGKEYRVTNTHNDKPFEEAMSILLNPSRYNAILGIEN